LQAANAEAEEAQKSQRTVEPRLRLGQRVTHNVAGFHGVVVGWDRACCESERWRNENAVADLTQVRADVSVWLRPTIMGHSVQVQKGGFVGMHHKYVRLFCGFYNLL
jgi:Hemimethylated DNA-binding protein YccV like